MPKIQTVSYHLSAFDPIASRWKEIHVENSMYKILIRFEDYTQEFPDNKVCITKIINSV